MLWGGTRGLLPPLGTLPPTHGVFREPSWGPDGTESWLSRSPSVPGWQPRLFWVSAHLQGFDQLPTPPNTASRHLHATPPPSGPLESSHTVTGLTSVAAAQVHSSNPGNIPD